MSLFLAQNGQKFSSTFLCLHTGDSSVRCEQMDLLLQWGAEFRQSSSQSPEGEKVLEDLVAFDVILGDLNFDNCSSGIQSYILWWYLSVLTEVYTPTWSALKIRKIFINLTVWLTWLVWMTKTKMNILRLNLPC